MKIPILCAVLVTLSVTSFAQTKKKTYADLPHPPKPGDLMVQSFFENETRRIENRALANVESATDWKRERVARKRELFEMLGLQPLPNRSPLKPRITGRTELKEEGIVVENLTFESRPGLYVTGNLYRPIEVEGPLPTILYVCGHGKVKEGDVSYGNKTHYQYHGAWFARHGYVCLMIDTLQLGEIEGHHHGTFKLDRWWWPSRGYTPAGVEAWNCMRALDYLETREEVDAERMGVTGRSGGGAYSWWIAALDDRIKAAVPVAGITSMHNHIVDGCIEGHCDCMFMVNTYRWDFPLLSSLVAPRALLIANTDNDKIFPLDGVVDVYAKTRGVYELMDAEDKIGLAILEGPHADSQALRTPAFEWFERHLKGVSPRTEIADTAAPKLFEKEQLRVFEPGKEPDDERNTAIDDYFTRRAPRSPKPPESVADWRAQSNQLMSRLKSKSFRAWPTSSEPVFGHPATEVVRDGLRFRAFDFVSQDSFLLTLYVVQNEKVPAEDLDLVVLNVLDDESWPDFLSSMGSAFPEAFSGITLPELDSEAYADEKKMHEKFKWGMAYVAPRGVGLTSWTDDEKERVQVERRFYLLGMTKDSAQVWDIRRSMQMLRSVEGLAETQLWLQSRGEMGVNTAYASLFEPPVYRLDLHGIPTTHRDGPHYLNVLRYLDVSNAIAMATDRAERCVLYVEDPKKSGFDYVEKTGGVLGWEAKRFEVRAKTDE